MILYKGEPCSTDEDCEGFGDWPMGYYCCFTNGKCCQSAVYCDCPSSDLFNPRFRKN